MELLRKGFGRLSITTGFYYRGFRKFNIVTKIVVIGGGLFAEFTIIGVGGVSSNSFWVRLAEIVSIHFTLLVFLIGFHKKIEAHINSIKEEEPLLLDELGIFVLSDEEKAALESERMNVEIIEVTGLPVPMALRPEESKYRKKWRALKLRVDWERKGVLLRILLLKKMI